MTETKSFTPLLPRGLGLQSGEERQSKILNQNLWQKSRLLGRGVTGFTLIETLVVIFIFILAMGAISASLVILYRTQSYNWQQSLAIEEARRGIEIMVKELREAKSGEDGSYLLEKADDKEIIFYGDIDKDDQIERIRYFLGGVGSGTSTQKCVSYSSGGACSVSFSNFLKGNLTLAQVKVSLEGDFGAGNEYAEIYTNSLKLGEVCKTGCSDCAGAWQGATIFDVTEQARDNSISLTADSTSYVNPGCNWEEQNHSMKANFELNFSEETPQEANILKKGIINPIGEPVTYPLDQEEVLILSSYVRNGPSIFEYFDSQGNKITETPARLVDTKLIRVYLVINVDPNRPPNDFELESSVQLRNLR